MNAEDFIVWLRAEKNYSQHTVAAYESDLKQFSSYLLQFYEIKNLSLANTSIARSWVASILDSGITASSARRKIVSVSRFYEFLLARREVSSNPFQKVLKPKSPKRVVKSIAKADLESLFEANTDYASFSELRDATVLKVLYTLGLRKSELIGLKIENLDFSRQEAYIKGKGNKMRAIPFPNGLIGEISKYLEARKEYLSGMDLRSEDSVFITDSGRPLYPTFVNRLTKRALGTLAHLAKTNPHALRHSFATHMLSSGANLKAIQDLLGHSSLASTEVYTHNSIEQLKKVYRNTHPKS